MVWEHSLQGFIFMESIKTVLKLWAGLLKLLNAPFLSDHPSPTFLKYVTSMKFCENY